MAIIPPLKLTRDQLASFLQDFEQIKQFENLFATVQTLAPITGQDFTYVADNAQATANNALAQISELAQQASIEAAIAENRATQALQMIEVLQSLADLGDQKAVQALDSIHRMATSLELLALAPVRNNIELSHDVNGILPYANQTERVRSNQVLTWLSM